MIESIPYVLTGIGIIVSILYYTSVLRNANKTRELQLRVQEQAIETRQMQLFMTIYKDLNTKESHQDWAELVNKKIEYDEYLEKYDSHVNPVHFGKRTTLGYIYNTIGELLRLELIKIDLLHRLNVDSSVVIMWENWEHIIRKTRERENMPDIWDGFEYLYLEMKKLRKSQDYPDITYTT